MVDGTCTECPTTNPATLALATTVEQFLLRMREGAQSLSRAERQRVVRLLIREVRIGKESVTICHPIPVLDPTLGREKGNNL